MLAEEYVRENMAEIVPMSGVFENEFTFDIGFINPNHENWQGDGIANDETELTAGSIDDLEELYEEFCKEEGIPCDTVTYVEFAPEPVPKTFILSDQVNAMYEFLGVPHADARKMDDYDLRKAYRSLSAEFEWVKQRGVVQLCPKHKASGTVLLPQ